MSVDFPPGLASKTVPFPIPGADLDLFRFQIYLSGFDLRAGNLMSFPPHLIPGLTKNTNSFSINVKYSNQPSSSSFKVLFYSKDIL